jgi:hypothetical protein
MMPVNKPRIDPSPLVGEGGVGGREEKSLPSTVASHFTTPTPNPSPQGGGEPL